jgi:hypothetical protein
VPWSPIFLPATSPTVNTVVMLPASLIFLVSMPWRFPAGTMFFSIQYSESRMSKLFGWVTARFTTSSEVTGMYSMLIPRSSFTFSLMPACWLTAVPM